MKIILTLLLITLSFTSSYAATPKNSDSKKNVKKVAQVINPKTIEKETIVVAGSHLVKKDNSKKNIAKGVFAGVVVAEIIDEVGDALEDDDEPLSGIIPTLDSMIESNLEDKKEDFQTNDEDDYPPFGLFSMFFLILFGIFSIMIANKKQ